MATDDVPIDRRILQEADTLLADGHQVILIAGWAPDRPTHEMIGQIRVERLAIPSGGRRELLAGRVTGFASRAINALSARSQRIVGRGVLVVYRSGVLALRVLRFVGVRGARASGWLERAARRVRHVDPESRYAQVAEHHVRSLHDVAVEGLSAVQPRVGQAAVGLTAKSWWVVGMANAKLSPRLVTLALRSRRVPLRDRVIADRIAYYRPDVIHVHDLPQLRAGVLAADKVSVPLVYDAHELYPEIGTLTPRQQRSLGKLEKRLMPECDATITVNPYIAQEMAKRYRVAAPTVILNAIDGRTEGRRRDDRDLRTVLGLPADACIVLFQGWLSPTRGLDHLVNAVARTDTRVHLVFMSYGDMIAELLAQAGRLGIADRVHFQPAVPQHELLDWTASADIGVIPYPAVDLNHHYCSPNKLFEFIQAGLPIVANDLPFLRDVVVGEGVGAVAPIEQPERFAAAIDSIALLDPADRAALQDRIREAAPRFSWASQEPVLRSLYAGLGAPR